MTDYGDMRRVSAWIEQMIALLGVLVDVTYSLEHGPTRGVLLGFTDLGEVHLEELDGTHRWTWPCLTARAVD